MPVDETGTGGDAIGRLDAAYQPIPPFSAWAGVPVDDDVWDAYAERWQAARDELSPSELGHLVADLSRGAAFDTGAIEGLYEGDRGITVTVMAAAAGWEAIVAAERGGDVVELVRAQFAGYRMALDLATGGRPVTEAWLRQVHEVVCAPQRTHRPLTAVGWQDHALPKGRYKDTPNHVVQADGSAFAYAPVADTPSEMHRLVGELDGDDYVAAHPAVQSAYAHHAFVRIHPFADGNGRVGRVLASVPLLRAVSVPLMLYADQRPEYLAALRAADGGDPAALARFVVDRAVDSMGQLDNLGDALGR